MIVLSRGILEAASQACSKWVTKLERGFEGSLLLIKLLFLSLSAFPLSSLIAGLLRHFGIFNMLSNEGFTVREALNR